MMEEADGGQNSLPVPSVLQMTLRYHCGLQAGVPIFSR